MNLADLKEKISLTNIDLCKFKDTKGRDLGTQIK
jgi:hypothetical protein